MQKTYHPFLLLTLLSALSLYAVGSPQASSSTARSFAARVTHSPVSPAQETVGEITKANWQQHPKIKQVRTVVEAVKEGMSSKSFTTKKRVFEYCEPYEDTERILATDSSGRARFYQSEGGSEDSALKFEHYYDEAGHLRFVFITGGATNGSELEHRIYFDEAGKRIWEKQTYKKGPGYTFPEVWPDKELQITDAAVKFSSSSPCPEVKPKAGKRKRSSRS